MLHHTGSMSGLFICRFTRYIISLREGIPLSETYTAIIKNLRPNSGDVILSQPKAYIFSFLQLPYKEP